VDNASALCEVSGLMTLEFHEAVGGWKLLHTPEVLYESSVRASAIEVSLL
jgi:hypothetical protein